MALSIRTIEIYPTAENLSARPGPIVPHYAITLDAPNLLRQWVPGDASYADGYYILNHVGGNAGRWVPVEQDDAGDNLANEDATIRADKKLVRFLPANTLTANRQLTIGAYTADAPNVALVQNGTKLTITRLDTEAYTYEIFSEVAPSGPSVSLITLPASKAWFVDLRFQDTQWHLLRAGSMTP